MLTLRQRLGVVIGGVLLVIVLIVLGFWWSRRAPKTPPTSSGQALTTTEKPAEKPSEKPANTLRFGEKPVTAPSNVNAEELFIRQLATIFVERFDTRSTQDSNKHINDVLAIVTPSMAAWLQTQKSPATATSTYEGVTAQALAANLEKRDGDKATVSIGVQETITQTGGNKIVQRNGRVELVKLNGTWKVDGLYWQK